MKYRPRGSGYIRGKCLIKDCTRLQRVKGKDQMGRRLWQKVCDVHHRIKYDIPNPLINNSHSFFKQHIPNDKCSNCGWDKASCDRHRLDNSIGYIPENVIILCPNCHRLQQEGKLLEIPAEKNFLDKSRGEAPGIDYA